MVKVKVKASARGEKSLDLPINEFFLSNKSIVGNVYGLTNARAEFPKFFALYRSGALKLDELITREYRLDEINQGYADMHAGKNIRGLVVM
jgi:Zn-dependent alcohol dehydrogenase